MTLYLRYAAKSDVGMVRPANEDSGFAGRTLLAVADGMGGHAAGELASSTAIATLAELDSGTLTEDLLPALQEAIATSAERIGQFIQADRSRAGMGTTLTAILWQSGRIAVINVGDSRAYLLRDGELAQITHDHTYVQSLIDQGQITPAQARTHPKRNLLLRAIDGSAIPEGEGSVREAQVGDRFLLCSDGLCGYVEDEAIAQVLRDVSDPTAAVTALVDLALEAGAPDNVTAVVADVLEASDDEVARLAADATPVVVGAAGEQRNRDALPGLSFPDDVGVSGDQAAMGPQVVGGLVARGADRNGAEDHDDPTGGSAGPGPDDEIPPRPGFVRRHLMGVSVAGVVLIGMLVGAGGFLWWLSSQWYVGSQSGYVTIYQGVPQTFLGVSLNRSVTQTSLMTSTLPVYDQQQLEQTIEAPTEADAQRIVADLQVKATACQADPAPAGCPSTALPDSAAEPSPSPTPTATPSTSPPAQAAGPAPGTGGAGGSA